MLVCLFSGNENACCWFPCSFWGDKSHSQYVIYVCQPAKLIAAALRMGWLSSLWLIWVFLVGSIQAFTTAPACREHKPTKYGHVYQAFWVVCLFCPLPLDTVGRCSWSNKLSGPLPDSWQIKRPSLMSVRKKGQTCGNQMALGTAPLSRLTMPWCHQKLYENSMELQVLPTHWLVMF